MTSVLLDSKLDKEQRECAGTIRASSETLLQLINSVLDFSRIEAGRLDIAAAPFDLAECVESALDLAAGSANSKRVDLSYSVDDDVPKVVIGDANRFRQIVTNLVTNAVKFTESGSVSVTVARAASATDREGVEPIELRVSDTGIGIPPERIPSLFEPFTQLEATTQYRFGGSGLGLAISKQLAELMGGSLRAESEGIPGRGATFVCSIPFNGTEESEQNSPIDSRLSGVRAVVALEAHPTRALIVRLLDSAGLKVRIVEPQADQLEEVRRTNNFDLLIVEDEQASAREDTMGDGGPALVRLRFGSDLKTSSANGRAFLTRPVKPRALLHSVRRALDLLPDRDDGSAQSEFDSTLAERCPLRLLLAEDIIVNQQLATKLLSKMGYRADVVGNGIEALEALRRQRYDALLLDVQMPGIDGIETARRISKEWTEEHRPYIVALTANALSGDRERCLEAGMNDFLTKPIRVGELQEALMRASQSRRANGHHGPVPMVESHGGIVDRDGTEPTISVDPAALATLRETLDGGSDADEFIAWLISDYRERCSMVVRNLRRAAEIGDREGWTIAAHTLKGQSGTVGAVAVQALCQSLENLPWPLSLASAEEALTELEATIRDTDATFAEGGKLATG